MTAVLQPLAVGFRWGVALRRAAYQRGWLQTRRLKRPVVSVGNLTVGGTGKTPLVVCIAGILLKHGALPSILTRGYGRRPGPDLLLLEPGSRRVADPRAVGEEPAWLARALPEVPIVVCADRHRAGVVAEERFHAQLHILDDGFQHLALARDLDLVVLDVTQEFSDRALLPAGRMREPCSGLARAQAVVLSRVELADPGPLEERVRQINPQARIFRSRTELCGLVEVSDGKAYSPDTFRARPVSAFCGVGNPRSFFADLRKWGFSVVSEETFPDHHVYTAEEISRLIGRAPEAGAAALLTTEKDAMNFPRLPASQTPILACAARTQVADREEFETMLRGHLENTREAS